MVENAVLLFGDHIEKNQEIRLSEFIWEFPKLFFDFAKSCSFIILLTLKSELFIEEFYISPETSFVF